MKRYLSIFCLALLSSLAMAQTVTQPPLTDKLTQPKVGTTNLGALVTNDAGCNAAIAANAASQAAALPAGTKKTVGYTCVNTKATSVTLVGPPVCPTQPATTTATQTCPSGTTGTWTQTTTFTLEKTPTTCVWKSSVSPTSAPAASCPPVVVTPPATVTWTKVASEGATYTLAKDSVVRFGYHGWEDVGNAFVSNTLKAGSHVCGIADFAPAADPKPGNAKQCEVSSAAPPVVVTPSPPASAPTTDPIPTPPPVPVDPPASSPTPMPMGMVTVNVSLIPDVKKSQNPVGGWSQDMLIPTTEVAPPSDIGAFRTGCQATKYAFDDPIVYPGQPGKSHLHTFFGNTGIDAYSTATSLSTTGNSTCRGGTINRSSYWVPSMIDTRTGAPLAPMFESNFYYKTGYALPPASITEVPLGLRMIAGSASGNPSLPSGAAIYACVWDGGNSNWSASIPTDCPATANSWLIMGIDFPQCWDGVNLDSPDHKSHMTNPVNVKANNTGNCPATHPVALPQIAYQILYQVKVTGETKYWRLSSDNYDLTKPAGFSGHGDYFMAWKPEIVKAWTKNCDNAQKDCHSHLLGDGRAMVIP